MTSFRTRIALLYAILVVAVIGVGAIAINFSFRSLLLDQARERVTRTSDEIARSVAPTGLSGTLLGDIPVLTTLGSQSGLDTLASPTTIVQIDTLGGQPLGSSSNAGGVLLPNRATLTIANDRHLEELHTDLPTIGDLLVLDRLVIVGDRPIAIAHVAEKLGIIETTLQRARAILIGVTFAALVLVLAASYFLARSAVEPIVELTEAMRGIGSDRLDRRLAWTDRVDEVQTLAATFDAMLARLQEAFARERQFISDASHELKTPLTVINANAQMLQRWADRDETIRRESLEAIIDESGQLAQMVNGMLLLAKADSGDAIPKEPLVLDSVVADVVAHLDDRAQRKGLRLDYFPNGTPSIVLGDANLLRQVVTNLTDNAIKFTAAGTVGIAIAQGETTATISVIDTGPGIDDAQADLLFNRFFRSDTSHTRSIEGTGLGLAIVRSIVRIHGGTVSARSRPEGGSIFSVTLPREAVDDATLAEATFTDIS